MNFQDESEAVNLVDVTLSQQVGPSTEEKIDEIGTVTSENGSNVEDNFPLNSPLKIVVQETSAIVDKSFKTNAPLEILIEEKGSDVEKNFEVNSPTKIAASEVKTSLVETSSIAVNTSPVKFADEVHISPVKLANEVHTSPKNVVDKGVNTSPVKFADELHFSPVKFANEVHTSPKQFVDKEMNTSPAKVSNLKEKTSIPESKTLIIDTAAGRPSRLKEVIKCPKKQDLTKNHKEKPLLLIGNIFFTNLLLLHFYV